MTNLRQLWYIICLLPMAGYSQPHTNTQSQRKLFEQVDTYLQTQIDTAKQSPVPGIAIAIVKEKQLVHVASFGVVNIQTNQALKPENTFHVASVSKTFAATAILQLAERKKLRLDDKLIHYLPYFSMADERYRAIILRQILNHTSGMPDVDDYQWERAVADEGAAERWTRSLSTKKLLSAPGTAYHYSNMAYDLLADVVAKVSGQSFEHYVKEHILQPLQMARSSFLLSDINPVWRTSPHTGVPLHVGSVYPYNRMHAPSSTLNTNVIDLSHWLIANLNQGIYKTARILSEASVAKMQTATFSIDSASGRAVGLSWFTYPYGGVRIIHHDGADDGYVATLYLIPSRQLGFVILFNSDEVDSHHIKQRVLDLLLTSAL